jgi:hypothetical protein
MTFQTHDGDGTHGRREAHVGAAGQPVPSSPSPDSRPGGHGAGHDRRLPGSNPRPPQKWRHVRTGRVSNVVYVAPDESYLYTSESGVAWPTAMFLARWERV